MSRDWLFKNKRNLWQARPNLQVVAPLTFWLCIGFSALNLALGYVIYQTGDSSLAIHRILSPKFLGGVLALLAALMLITLILNAWSYIRLMLFSGLFIKSFYAYSLIDLGIRYGFEPVNGILAIWFFVLWVQFVTIVFFAPPSLNGAWRGASR